MPYFQDKVKLPSRRTYTDDGYLRVPARIGRVGVQTYRAHEIGLKDRDPNELVNVYRSPEEVFDKESMESFQNKPVTNDHPPKSVKATNYDKFSVGHSLSNVDKEDDEFLTVDLLVTTQKGIDAIERGKTQVSNGYKADIEKEDGTYKDQAYQFKQVNIRGNHIAIVNRGRAGPGVKLSDEGNPTVKIKIKGVSYEIPDGPAAEAVQMLVADSDQLQTDLDTANGTITKKDGEIQTLKDSAPDVEALVAGQVAFLGQVKMVDAEYDATGKTQSQVKRELLKKQKPDLTIDKDTQDAYVDGAWDTLVKDSKTVKDRKTDTTDADSTLASLFDKQADLTDSEGKPVDTRPADVKAREEMIKRNRKASGASN